MQRCFLVILLGTIAGCGGPAYTNRELATYDSQAGYRFEALDKGEGNTDETFVCLTFSGGGTRAAALAYGVLQELRDTPLPPVDGSSGQRRLLDEVDVISSVSGGSFTAAAYALWRESFFDGRFEKRFLYRNVQRELIFRVFAPLNLLLLPYIVLDRIDIAADYFHDEVFEQRTYKDLVGDTRPLIAINATNVASGGRFEFTQGDFDILGSDLASMPIGYAVAASSAVPVVLSPMRLKYYANAASTEAIRESLTNAPPEETRLSAWARSLLPEEEQETTRSYRIDHDDHRFLYLLDGAMTDNLGLTWVIDNYRDGVIRKLLDAGPGKRIRRLVVIVVNAGTRPREYMEERDSAPGMLMMGYKAATIAIESNSNAIIDTLRLILRKDAGIRAAYEDCAQTMDRACPTATAPEAPTGDALETYVIEVDCRHHRNPAERQHLINLRTSLHLPESDIDALIRSARTLLRESEDYRRLLRDLRRAP